MKTFDKSNISEAEKKYLEDFFLRRQYFQQFLETSKMRLHTCPGCGFPTLTERGTYEICPVCDWEDDNQDDATADEVWGGPNADLSLTENRLKVGEMLGIKGLFNIHYTTELAKKVIDTIQEHEKILDKVLKDIPGYATLDHPAFQEYREAKKRLFTAIKAVSQGRP